MEFSNPYLVTAVVVTLVSQLIRLAWNRRKTKAVNWADLKSNYGTLATHQSVVSGVALSTVVVDGWKSPVFSLALVYAVVSVVITRSARADKDIDRQLYLSSMLGVAVAGLVMFGYWGESVTAWLVAPTDITLATQRILLVFAAILFAGVGLISWLNLTKIKQLPTSRRLKRAIRVSVTGPAVLGVVATVLLRNEVSGFTNLFWVSLTGLWILGSTIYMVKQVYLTAPARLREEGKHFRGKPGTRPTNKKSSPKKPQAKKAANKRKTTTPKKKSSK